MNMAFSCAVPEADAKVAASMIKRLGGMRMCEEGTEGSMTHLVLGSPRRTLKVQIGLLSQKSILPSDGPGLSLMYWVPCAVCGYRPSTAVRSGHS